METIFTIDRFEGEQAVLITEDGKHSLVFPRRLLPESAGEGAVLNFDIKTLGQAEEEKRKKAKDILNEILDIGGDSN